MGDTEEAQLEQILDNQEEAKLEHELEELADTVDEKLEEVVEQVEAAVEEVLERPPDLIIESAPQIDYDILADKVAERLAPPVEPNPEPVDEPEPETAAADEDEPPESKSFLYGKRI